MVGLNNEIKNQLANGRFEWQFSTRNNFFITRGLDESKIVWFLL
jgi:hypothetical protein